MGAQCGKDSHPPGQPVAPPRDAGPGQADRSAGSADRPLPPPPRPARGGGKRNSAGVGRALFISHAEGTLDTIYDLGDKAGEGTQGVVFKAVRKGDGAKRAVKRVQKTTIRAADVQSFKKECEIMKSMDHPNIVKLYETFEDKHNYFLVMELCNGGELLDRIIKQGHLSEAQAAVVVQQVLRAVFYMHENGIVHRDLKPENFLLADDDHITNDNLLKLIDFGIATRCAKGQVLTDLCGTPFYVAPQVVTKRYDKRCDLWSVGVIMYTLLSGTVPFNGSDQEILRKARVGIVNYPGLVWNPVSEPAKLLLKALLTRNVDNRISAEAALTDDWIKTMAPKAAEAALPSDILDRLNSFRNKNIVKKACLQIIAGEMNNHELDSLRKIFTSLDDNGDGKLTIAELQSGLTKAGFKLPVDIKEILRGIDADGSGIVDYTEFLAATLDRTKDLNERVVRTAFRKFDLNGDGTIRAKEIVEALSGGNVSAQRQFEKMADQVIAEYGASSEMDFKAFFCMMTDRQFIEEVCPEVTPAIAVSSSRRILPDIACEADEDHAS